ncbi:MAG: acetyl-CoA acetyltransferase [Gammaproteobacteria bacterium]|nr:acetyl-CoA acetyltransferase [Gammaproteobacteria bacterium]
MNAPSPQHIPVLVGIGVATCRENDFARAPEPIDLMLEAVRAAGADTGNPATLVGAQYIAIPHGRWRYRNPGGAIARAIGATHARSVFASVGVLQQSLLGEACALIARGEIHTALVTGGDSGHRLLRAQIAEQKPIDRVLDDEPNVRLTLKEELFHPAESALGLVMPIGLYAIMESAYRAKMGWTVDEHRNRLAAMYAQFSEIAADNPHAWKRDRLTPENIRDASSKNPMQAFPYTRSMCSTFNVDQAAALLFCSAARAIELGIPREQWIYPLASTESNHMVPVSARGDLAVCPGAAIAGNAALAVGNLKANQIDLLDLYSCFPIAVESYAEELGISLARQLTITGGMSFAGGPWNNYVFQATCRAAELLRAGLGRHALITSVSGLLTKQGFGLWSREIPTRPFEWHDVSHEVARAQRVVEVLMHYSGSATIAGYTVLYSRDQSPTILALVDTPSGARALVTSQNSDAIERVETDEWVGHTATVRENKLGPL